MDILIFTILDPFNILKTFKHAKNETLLTLNFYNYNGQYNGWDQP